MRTASAASSSQDADRPLNRAFPAWSVPATCQRMLSAMRGPLLPLKSLGKKVVQTESSPLPGERPPRRSRPYYYLYYYYYYYCCYLLILIIIVIITIITIRIYSCSPTWGARARFRVSFDGTARPGQTKPRLPQLQEPSAALQEGRELRMPIDGILGFRFFRSYRVCRVYRVYRDF